MIRYFTFKDADGIPGLIGQQTHGSTARDTHATEIAAADKHLLHHVRVFGWTDVIAYHPETPLPIIMKRANEILAEKGMDPKFDEEDIKQADPKYEKTHTIHRYDISGKLVPVHSKAGPNHTERRMAAPIIGAPIAPDDPNHPLIRHAAVQSALDAITL